MAVSRLTSNEFIDDQPIEGADDIYAYVRFSTLERAEYGLVLTDNGPWGKILEYIQVGETGFDPSAIAPLTDINEAIEVLRSDSKYAFEEFPFVEVGSEEEYENAMLAAGESFDPDDYDGPGIYDFRDRPFTRHLDNVESYEREGMEFWADDVMESMFQGDEWKKAAGLLKSSLLRRR